MKFDFILYLSKINFISMIKQKRFDFYNMPYVSLTDHSAIKEIGNNKWKAIIVDILDGDLWTSKVSFTGNIILIISILISSFSYILTNGSINFSSPFQYYLEIITGLIFTIEIFFRIYFSKYLGYNKRKFPILSYSTSFTGIIDILCVITYLHSISNIEIIEGIGAIRILRLWRITRYIKAFNGLSEAFNSRKEEIIVTFVGVMLLSLTLSAIMYHVEISKGATPFSSIMSVFIWSMGKYTGDYGSISGATPISDMGKAIATINGLLGIALFAIPAGLLASAFIDQLAEIRLHKSIKERYTKIENYFQNSSGGGKHFEFKARRRYASFDTVQVKFVYSDEELFEAIRSSNSLRFRAMKSAPELKYNDTRIIECFEFNCNYGCKYELANSSVFVVNPIGNNERGISHFSHSLATSLDVNYFSREIPLQHNHDVIGYNKSIYYSQYLKEGETSFDVPFVEFMQDISKAKKGDLILILSSAASGRSDFVIEYGNQKNKTGYVEGETTFNNKESFESTLEIIKNNLSDIKYRTKSEKDLSKSYTIEESTIGFSNDDSLIKAAHSLTNADVLSIYVNIKILTGETDDYYTALTAICKIVSIIKQKHYPDKVF